MHLTLSTHPVRLPADFSLRLVRTNPLYSTAGTFSLDCEIPLDDPTLARLLSQSPEHPQQPPYHLSCPFHLEAPEAGFTSVDGLALLTEIDERAAHFKLTADSLSNIFASGDTSTDISALPGATAYIDELTYEQQYPTTVGNLPTSYLPPYPSCYVATIDDTPPAADDNSPEAYLYHNGEVGCVYVDITGDSVDYPATPPSPRLPSALERILQAATGLTLPPQNNCLRYHPTHSRLCIANVRPTGDLAYILPHWTLQEFLLELRRLLGIVISRTGDTLSAVYFHDLTRYQPTKTQKPKNQENEEAEEEEKSPEQELHPLLPRTYTLSDAEVDPDDPTKAYTEQLDPAAANTAYDFPTEPRPLELIPDTLRALASHITNSEAARTLYAGAHHGIQFDMPNSSLYDDGPHHWHGDTTQLVHTLDHSAAPIPLDDPRTMRYVSNILIRIDSPGAIYEYSEYPLAGLPPITAFYHNDTNRDPYTVDPETNCPIRHEQPVDTRLYECDYLAPALRHDVPSRHIDYKHRIVPLQDNRPPTNYEHVTYTTAQSSEGDFFRQLRAASAALFPMLEGTEEIPTAIQKPAAPTVIELFIA